MRWTYPKSPKHDDIRERTVFAWYPIGIDGIVYWLERITIIEKYWSYSEMWMIEKIIPKK